MTYREHMRVKLSEGEFRVTLGLQTRKLNRGMVTFTSIRLRDTDMDEPREFDTIPDWYWPSLDFCAYLDGPHHRSPTYEAKDEKIVRYLWDQKHIKAPRFPYVPPLRSERLVEILDAIEKGLKERGYHG
jgi:hypothetical protein